jgi:DNA-binding transcriptional regulator YhcF (GntR family)
VLIRLKPGSDVPIYLQIADAVGAQIDSGALEEGARLPAARSLAGSLGVNMHTVLRAYETLDARGLVVRRRGRAGVVVASPGVDRLASALVEMAKRQGHTKAEVVSAVERSW